MKGKKILGAIAFGFIGFLSGGALFCKLHWISKRKSNEKLERLRGYYSLLNQWLQLKHLDISLDKYFFNHSYHTVAIYGMGELGMRLYEELKGSEVKVRCAIDKKADSIYSDLEVYCLEDCPKDIDVIVVTPTFAYGEIKEELSCYVDCPIISLEDVLFEM